MNENRRVRLSRLIQAEPAARSCPNCSALVLDWHREWYTPQEKTSIYKKQASGDCPLCRKSVVLGFTVEKASDGAETPVLKRHLDLAQLWCEAQQGTTLQVYIQQTAAGQQYKGYFDDLEQQKQKR